MTSTYRTTCPSCGGSNYTIWNENNRGSYCWNCNYSERNSNAPIKEIKRSKRIPEIRAFYQEISEYFHSCLETEHRNWLYRRGISDYSIKKLKIGYCPPAETIFYKSDIAIEAGVYYNSHITHKGRITFPFIQEGMVIDLWSRAYSAEDEIKYKGCFSSAYRRGSDYTYCHEQAYRSPEYVVRTEGIIKAIVANQYGIPTVAYPGTTAYRNGTPPMLGQKQIICFDSQVSHRRELIKAIKTEAERYGGNAYIATLPLRGKNKQDCDSYILEYGIDDFKRVIDGALPYNQWRQLAA